MLFEHKFENGQADVLYMLQLFELHMHNVQQGQRGYELLLRADRRGCRMI